MRKLSNILLVFLFYITSSSAQEPDSINFLTDFDFLYETIKENSISVDLYCNQINANFESVYMDLRTKLMLNNTFDEFIESSLKLFNLSGDLHNQFINYEYFNSLVNYLPEHEKVATFKYVDTISKDISKTNFEYLIKNRKKRNNYQNIKTTYYSNGYHLTYKTIIGKTKLNRFSKIIAINDRDVNDFINSNKYCFKLLSDIHNDNYYVSSLFSSGSNLPDINSVSIFDSKKKKILKCEIDSTTKISIQVPTFVTINLNRIFHIRQHNTLYIRLVRMIDQEEFLKKLEKFKNKSFDRVIVDVRDNSGGNDMTWINVLSYLIDSSSYLNRPLSCSKKSQYLVELNREIEKNVSLANNDIMTLDNNVFDYIPSQNNKIYSKEGIYCFSNKITFSSALAFASLKNYLKNFKLVSDNAPYMGGLGQTPLVFMMPSSKLMFRLSCLFDYKLYSNKTHRVQPDILIDYRIKREIQLKNSFIRNYSGKRYCLRKNPFFDEILKN